jgi:hypothetical protein
MRVAVDVLENLSDGRQYRHLVPQPKLDSAKLTEHFDKAVEDREMRGMALSPPFQVREGQEVT